MKNLFNIISAFRYYLITLLWILIILLMIKGKKSNLLNELDESEYKSEAGFNYLEDTDVFD
jgi:hypothetical protein